MKIVAASLLSLGLGLAAGSASQAMPVAPIASSQPEVIQVAQGCGPGTHHRPYSLPSALRLPPGWHPGLWRNSVSPTAVGDLSMREGGSQDPCKRWPRARGRAEQRQSAFAIAGEIDDAAARRRIARPVQFGEAS
jgi:hypothetical protein